ncbi:MAG: Eco57I restriction-modification methylase domain-containing protein [Candidatus Gracilibacteria bacterium]
MAIKILEEIYKYTNNENEIHSILVYLFIKKNNLTNIKNKHIKSLLKYNTGQSLLVLEKLLNYIGNLNFGFEDLILEFEKIVSHEEKITNGVVYTPKHIREYIIEQSMLRYNGDISKINAIDISCGCGNFLFSLSKYLKGKTNKSYIDIFKENIYGIDILKGGIERTKILLELLAIYEGDDNEVFSFNLEIGNSLSLKLLKKYEKKLNLVIGNPPYVRSKNLSLESKKMLNDWKVSNIGNPDLYIPFFQIGLSYLKNKGVLGYITVNSFFKSLNARELRSFISNNKYNFDIIDFGGQQIFESKSTYTCLCFIVNNSRNFIKYKKLDNLDFVNKEFIELDYNILDNKNGWVLNNNENIIKIENTGKKIGNLFDIKNGIATLKNDIYIFTPISEDKDNYIFIRNGKKYKVEKGVCKDIIKPNTLKFDDNLDNKIEKIIFPYYIIDGKVLDIEEKEFINKFKNTYKYLSDFKDILFNREKGNGKNFNPWYKFGRNQALLDTGYKILLPYMAGKFNFQITDKKDLLLYCGYAIFSDKIKDLQIINRILSSEVFDYYVKNTSKPYSGKFYSLAKNHIKDFGICDLTEDEQKFILKEKSNDKINKFLLMKYDLDI